MAASFDELYPNMAWWAQGGGWIEVGRCDGWRSLIRGLDIGSLLWKGKQLYDSIGAAMDEAERFITQWRRENGC